MLKLKNRIAFAAALTITNSYAQTGKASLLFEAVSGGKKPIGIEEPLTQNTLDLKGARGETLNFMLKLGIDQCVKLTPPVIKKISPDSWKFFRMPTIETQNPSFRGAYVGRHFDPLVPISDQMLCPADNLKGGMSWFWGELHIPKTLPPGTYSVNWPIRKGKGAPAIQIKLKVWKMIIPDRMSLPAYSEYSSQLGALAHSGLGILGESQLARLYQNAMWEHRLIPIHSALSSPKVTQNEDRFVTDLRADPTRATSFYSAVLENRPDWALFDFPVPSPEQFKAGEATGYFKAIEAASHSLNRVGKAFVTLTEVLRAGDLGDVKKAAEMIKKNAPSLSVMLEAPPNESVSKVVDIFAPIMDEFLARKFPTLNVYRDHQKRGGQVWVSVNCKSHGCEALEDSGAPDLVLDRDAAYIRSIGWIASIFETDGFLYYRVNEGYRKSPKRDPWKNLWDFTGNGDGTLFYPGRPGVYGLRNHVPIPSIRLKLWRESSYDAEYFKWMQSLSSPPKWWLEELNVLIQSPTRWNRNYSEYQRLRDRIGEYLDLQ